MKPFLLTLLLPIFALGTDVALERSPEDSVHLQSHFRSHPVSKEKARHPALAIDSCGIQPGMSVWDFSAAYADGERFVVMH